MTNEEAAGILYCLEVDDEGCADPHMWYKGIQEQVKEALCMGIKALLDKHKDRKKAKRFKRKYMKLRIALSKMRMEIAEERQGYPPSADYYKAISKVLQIIDKYKSEE